MRIQDIELFSNEDGWRCVVYYQGENGFFLEQKSIQLSHLNDIWEQLEKLGFRG